MEAKKLVDKAGSEAGKIKEKANFFLNEHETKTSIIVNKALERENEILQFIPEAKNLKEAV